MAPAYSHQTGRDSTAGRSQCVTGCYEPVHIQATQLPVRAIGVDTSGTRGQEGVRHNASVRNFPAIAGPADQPGTDDGAGEPAGTPVPPPFAPFAAALPFRLSDYQREALAALARPDTSVLVVAPTGSGKSVLADAAIWQAIQHNQGAAYVSPLRALANQRFEQMMARWGNRVGLLTGDTTIRPDAPVRVMTAEVYRAIVGQPDGAPPAWAIFDEAHYLADPERGAVWEESLLMAPPQTRLLCLSATIGAPDRLAGWLRWLGRDVALVIHRQRPVPLRHYLFHRGTVHEVLDDQGQRTGSFPFAGGWARAQRHRDPGRFGAYRRRREAPMPGLPDIPPDEWVRRESVAALAILRERDWTPVIAFLSSRRETERLAADAREAFPDRREGIAFHHGGMLPAGRRDIEQRLRDGALWLVCATTTLAAGIDVPARSVLVTTYGHFDGREFTLFTPAEYRQLTGRAGRLGMDDAGAAVLLASPWHGFDEAFRQMAAPEAPITSAFRPGYATALAWWASDGEARLAAMLARTFATYLRRSRAGKPPPDPAPDGPAVLEARATGRLLALDGLVDAQGQMTPHGQFVRQMGGGSEGRLLLRALDDAGRLHTDGQVALLALLAGDPLPVEPTGAAGMDASTGTATTAGEVYRRVHAAQVALERQAGALLTAPAIRVSPAGDIWRSHRAAASLLKRALRAGEQSKLPLPLRDWGPPLLARLNALS